MNVSWGGLKISGNTTPSIAPGTAAKVTGWTAHGGNKQGDAGVTEDATNSRLTLVRGIYEVDAQVVVETEDVSGSSGDGIGIIAFQFYKGGDAVAGALAKLDAQNVDRPQTVSVKEVVEITQAQVDAATNYVELYADATDASGNDITISDARLFAKKLDN